MPKNQDPKIVQEDGIQGLGHSSPTDVAEVELMKLIEEDLANRLMNRPSIRPTNKISEEEEEDPQKRIKVMIPLPVSTRPAQQSGSAPPSREERLREN